MAKLLITLTFIFITVLVCAQDLHYTNYSLSSQLINPSLTGDFNGTYKISGIYRDQFSKFFQNGYSSISGQFDYNLPIKVGGDAWVAAGAFIQKDKAGDLGFGSTRTGLSAAYHLPFDTKLENRISVGVQGQYINRSTNGIPPLTELSLQGNPDPDVNLLNDYDDNTFDVSLGLLYNRGLTKTTKVKVGAGLMHLLATRTKISNGTRDYVPLRLNVHGELQFTAKNKLTFIPKFYFIKSQQAQEFILQFHTDIPLSKHVLRLGIGHRLQDAIQFMVGFDLMGWNVYGGFDMTTSSAKVYNDSFGAFEIGMSKIITTYPKAKVKLIQICPRL